MTIIPNVRAIAAVTRADDVVVVFIIAIVPFCALLGSCQHMRRKQVIDDCDMGFLVNIVINMHDYREFFEKTAEDCYNKRH